MCQESIRPWPLLIEAYHSVRAFGLRRNRVDRHSDVKAVGLRQDTSAKFHSSHLCAKFPYKRRSSREC